MKSYGHALLLIAFVGTVAAGSGFAQQAPAGRGQAPAAGQPAPAARGQAPAARGAARGRGAAAGGPTAWFGVPTPPPLGKEPAVIVGDRSPHPVSLPAGEAANPEFVGTTIRADLETIVGFSKESRATKEVGGTGQMWGRITGLPSGWKTVDWAAAQLRKAGIADVKQQPLQVAPTLRFWMPVSWEVRILGDPAFGAGTQDVVLESAIPLSPSDIPGGTLTAPLVYVGSPSSAVLEHIDVKGKIAVQLIVPQGHMVFERGPAGAGAAALVAKGAVGVFNLVRLPGNERSRDFSNCGNPCVNIGGRDGWFLEQILNRAADAHVSDKVRAQVTLKTENRADLKAQNAVAVVPGRSDETILIDAHVDAWFDGAGDNADGFSVMLALAKHFAKPANKPQRTLVFIASAGHHSPGMNGPQGFQAANPGLYEKAVLALNIEHVAQRNFSQARTNASDGYRQAIADTGEAPIYAGVTNQSAFLNTLIQQGVQRYGTNFVSEKSNMASGESGGFSRVNGPTVTIMQAPPLYHTTGEVETVISTPGLERMARFLSYFITEVDKAPRAQINPPGSMPARGAGAGAGDTP